MPAPVAMHAPAQNALPRTPSTSERKRGDTVQYLLDIVTLLRMFKAAIITFILTITENSFVGKPIFVNKGH